MGNGVGKLTVCFSGVSPTRRRSTITSSAIVSDPFDDLGHSFCYVRPDQTATTSFKSISGASVSANAATPLSTALFYPAAAFSSSAFEGSTSFASIPLQPIPRSSSIHSGPILNSGSLDRGFMSGPLERNFMSGPLDRAMYSGPLGREDHQFRRSFSHGGLAFGRRPKNWSLIRSLKRALSKGITRGQNSIVAPIKGVGDWVVGSDKHHDKLTGAVKFSEDHRGSLDGGDWTGSDQNIQWAQGKAGEDRVHVVVSEEHGWVFVGIYDGFNGPDAPDYLVSNLYSAVYNELKGLLWDDDDDDDHHRNSIGNSNPKSLDLTCDPTDESAGLTQDLSMNTTDNSSGFSHEHKKRKDPNVIPRNNYRNATKKRREENQRRWRREWDKERFELDRKLKEQFQKNGPNQNRATNHHNEVLKALASALKKTEESYFTFADELVSENPELALMGSCVLVMLMKGEDIYVMNVGDSRAVLARKKEPDLWSQDLERINEETLYDLEKIDGEDDDGAFTSSLSAFQLTRDHSTSVEEEIVRIRKEHPDDTYAVTNERVKGSLKVTRAFGAGFLKQPKWNDALLEMFRIDYVGDSAYINCVPSLYHHRIGPQDKFLVLSSDGLYQYFTNEEAVSEVELFISWSPEGDPAQHLVEELLFRAAKSAGMEFHELLEIRQGERRRYHDDVSIIVISLEGRIWRSCA